MSKSTENTTINDPTTTTTTTEIPTMTKMKSKSLPPYDSFYWTTSTEPHVIRRKQILEKYPEIKKLMGVCPSLKYILFLTTLAQLYVGYICHTFSWPIYLLVLFVFGSTMNHFFMMGIHELSHNICFKHPLPNKLFSIFVNLPVLLPYAITFRGYHAQHHKYQGEENIDVDLPTELEGRLFQTTTGKFFYFLLQAFFYVIRPLVVNPKRQSFLEIIHTIISYGFTVSWYYYLGPSGVIYFLFSTLIGTSFHPCAGHFFAEHYVFVEGYETYSYYGVLNWLTLNVGYHNEHHDFPYIPGFRLPLVRKIAPEFYDNLPQHPSWVGAQWQFILNKKMTAFSRVKRRNLTEEDKKKLN